MSETVIKIEGLKKQYRLGTIGGGTLRADIQSWWARKKGKEDPNTMIGTDISTIGESFYALNGINLEVKKGEALGIIGANGAGKSTLLKLLSRVTAPTEGTIRINGRIASMLEVGTGFHPELTGRENIYMNGAILGMTKKEIDSKIEEIIEFSECRKFIDTPVKRYSSGMYVKLAFAVAAHLDAEIMVMDEVLAVGDVKFQKKCLGKMGEEAKGGKTVLYVSHNMATIKALCNRCIVLNMGQIVFDGEVENAISVYLDKERENVTSIIDYTYCKRNQPEFGMKAYINRFVFCDEEGAKLSNKRPREIAIQWEAKQDIKQLFFRFTIVSVDGNVVGTIFSNIGVDGIAGNTYVSKFWLDVTNLAEGLYSFFILAFCKNEYGAYINIDKPEKRSYFEVYEDNNDIVWNKGMWGTVKLNALNLIEGV